MRLPHLPARLLPAVMGLAVALGVAVALVLVVGIEPDASPSSTPSAPRSQPTSSTRAVLDREIDRVTTTPRRVEVPGYDRDCGPGNGCVFGPAWTDDYDGPGGHDGCDTRNNVLQLELTDVTFRPGTHRCVVMSGTLDDPYTGRRIQFAKEHATEVQIDHLFPLALAWDMGASRWTLQRRIEFANDIGTNLLAADGSANASKGDRSPGEWMPVNGAFRCEYIHRFLVVALTYDLSLPATDVESMRYTIGTC